MRPEVLTVEAVEREGPGVVTLRFDESHDVAPGQFGMWWVPGVDEIPMSYAADDAILVRDVGEATAALCGMEPGDRVGVRGPFGEPFDVPSSDELVVVGGGTGMAPVAVLAETASRAGADVTVLIGAATADQVAYDDRLAAVADVGVATEDGTQGHEGLVTDLLDAVLVDGDGGGGTGDPAVGLDAVAPQHVATCGPEPMMAAVLDRFADRPGDVQVCLERYMKCGIGICGSCCIDDDGSPVCADGPVYRAPAVVDGEFGLYHRDAAGRIEEF